MAGVLPTLMPRLETIPDDIVIPEESLQQVVDNTNSGKHFTGSFLKFVWPELLCSNWNGQPGKTPLDERRKRVVELYTHFYYQETQHQTSGLIWFPASMKARDRKMGGRRWCQQPRKHEPCIHHLKMRRGTQLLQQNLVLLTSTGKQMSMNLDNIPASVNLISSFLYKDYLQC